MLIVGITVYALLFGFIRIDRKTLLKTGCITLGLFVGSIFVNNLFNLWMPDYFSNYFYTLRPEKGTPLELFYNWGKPVQLGFFVFNPVYLLCSAITGIAVICIMYGIYRLTQLGKSRAAETAGAGQASADAIAECAAETAAEEIADDETDANSASCG